MLDGGANAHDEVHGEPSIMASNANSPATLHEIRLDTSFGGFGRADVEDDSQPFVATVSSVVDDDGRTYLIRHPSRAGSVTIVNWAISRYRENGYLDEDYGDGGVAQFQLTDAWSPVVHFDPAGRLVMLYNRLVSSAEAGTRPVREVVLMRLTPDGDIDDTFADAGFVTVQQLPNNGGGPQWSSAAADFEMHVDGRIFVAVFSGESLAVHQLTADGTRVGRSDSGLPTRRIIRGLDFELTSNGWTALLLADSVKLLANHESSLVEITHLLPSGRVEAVNLSVDSQNRVLVLGGVTSAVSTDVSLFATRFNSSLTVDPAYGSQGTAVLALTDHERVSQAWITDTELAADGSVVGVARIAVESAPSERHSETAIAMLDPAGTRAAQFGEDGLLIQDILDDSEVTARMGVESQFYWLETAEQPGQLSVTRSGELIVTGRYFAMSHAMLLQMNTTFIGGFPYELLPAIGQLFVTRFATDLSEPPAPTASYEADFVTASGTPTNFGLVGDLLWLRVTVQEKELVRDRFRTAFTNVVLDGLEFAGEPIFDATIVDGQSELESATRLLNLGGTRSLQLTDRRAIELATIPLRVTRAGQVFAHLEAPGNQAHATQLVGVDDAVASKDIVFGSSGALAETWEERLDVDGDEAVTAMDVLAAINALNMRATPVASGRFLPSGALSRRPASANDTNRDSEFSPLDVLLVVNYLNSEKRFAKTASADQDTAARSVLAVDDDTEAKEAELIPLYRARERHE